MKIFDILDEAEKEFWRIMGISRRPNEQKILMKMEEGKIYNIEQISNLTGIKQPSRSLSELWRRGLIERLARERDSLEMSYDNVDNSHNVYFKLTDKGVKIREKLRLAGNIR